MSITSLRGVGHHRLGVLEPRRWHKGAVVVALVMAAAGAALVAPGARASTTSATWTQANVSNPASSTPVGRVGASMATDPTGKVVLFGGQSTSGPDLSDTWTWDGSTWTEHHPVPSPPARDGAAMAYDPTTGTDVLFGGYQQSTQSDLSDTWAWNGATWTQLQVAGGPSARDSASMAYDPSTGGLVLFGGVATTGARAGGAATSGNVNDTWTWDGTTWTQQKPATSPSARHGASMAQTSNASQPVVLFGGEDATQARQVRSRRAGGESIAELIRTFGVSRATVYRALQAVEPDPSHPEIAPNA